MILMKSCLRAAFFMRLIHSSQILNFRNQKGMKFSLNIKHIHFMRKILIIVFGVLILSCNSNKSKEPSSEAGSETSASPEPVYAVSCYEWTGNDDTIKVRLELNGNDVSGTIVYDYSRKDRNEGALKGKLNGDIIIADYSFDSEGSRSVRQVAFRKNGNDLIEGFGSMEEIDGKMSFTRPDSLIFNPSFLIPASDCQ